MCAIQLNSFEPCPILIFLWQCLPDEIAELQEHRRELERQRQNQNIVRSEAIHSEEELLKQDLVDHTEV